MGVELSGGGTATNAVEGDSIGTDASGTVALGNTGDGVDIESGATGETVGGTGVGAGNVIANSGKVGVRVSGSSSLGNSIFGDSIYATGTHVGIELTAGGNDNEPVPTITSITTSGGNTTIAGTVTAGSHRIEVFQNPSCNDPEGKTFLGAQTTTATGWSITIPALSSPAVTATSSDTSTGNTSRFTHCAL